MAVVCKLLGLVDLIAAALLFIYAPSVFKYLIIVPLVIKGITSLFG